MLASSRPRGTPGEELSLVKESPTDGRTCLGDLPPGMLGYQRSCPPYDPLFRTANGGPLNGEVCDGHISTDRQADSQTGRQSDRQPDIQTADRGARQGRRCHWSKNRPRTDVLVLGTNPRPGMLGYQRSCPPYDPLFRTNGGPLNGEVCDGHIGTN